MRTGNQKTVKDVVAMSLIHLRNSSVLFSRVRPAGPRCRGGASSLLRLAQPTERRLPTPGELGSWMSRAAGALMPVTGPLAMDAGHDPSGWGTR